MNTKIHEGEETLADVLDDIIYGNEIIIEHQGRVEKLDEKRLTKSLVEKRNLNLRLYEVIYTNFSQEEKLPSLFEVLYDSHYLQYGKHAYEVKRTGFICPVCSLEIDEFGYCGCGCGSG